MPAAPRSGGGADRLGMLTNMFEAAATPPTAGLRFRFGDRVICNVGKTGCIPGTVTQLHYREGTISTSPYQVMLDNDYWPCSSDDHECDHECDQYFVFSSQDTDNVICKLTSLAMRDKHSQRCAHLSTIHGIACTALHRIFDLEQELAHDIYAENQELVWEEHKHLRDYCTTSVLKVGIVRLSRCLKVRNMKMFVYYLRQRTLHDEMNGTLVTLLKCLTMPSQSRISKIQHD